MNIIKNIDKTFLNLFGYQIIQPNIEYIRSSFLIEHKYKDKCFLLNTLTSEIICYDENEGLHDKFLIEHWFKIDKNVDQYSIAKLYRQNREYNYKYKPESAPHKAVIFTTMDCNARCYYCFENGRHRKNMSDETAIKVGNFLVSKNKSYEIDWFGGEPLYNPNAIRIITDILRKNNVDFTSQFTTNGYLLDAFSLYELKYKWNTKSIQITLDGTEEIYLKSKNYVNKDKDAFKKVLNNLFTISQDGIRVCIRYNISTTNSSDIKCLIDEIVSDKRFNPNISMYAARLIREESNTEEDEITLCREEENINRYILSLGIASTTRQMFITYSDSYCLADAGNCYVINIDGNLGRCEHYSDTNQLCSIDNREINVKEICKFTEHRRCENCKKCELYPTCNLNNICEILVPCDDIGIDHYKEITRINIERVYDNFVKKIQQTLSEDFTVEIY